MIATMQLTRAILEGQTAKALAFYARRRKGEGYWLPDRGQPGAPPVWSRHGRAEGVRTKGFGVPGHPRLMNVKRYGGALRDEPLRRRAEWSEFLTRTPLLLDEGRTDKKRPPVRRTVLARCATSHALQAGEG